MDTETREEAALGPRLSWKPARVPARESLEGRYGRVVPVDAGRHAHDLFESSHVPGGDPAIWNYLGYGPFPMRPASRPGWPSVPSPPIPSSSPSSMERAGAPWGWRAI